MASAPCTDRVHGEFFGYDQPTNGLVLVMPQSQELFHPQEAQLRPRSHLNNSIVFSTELTFS